MSWDVERAVYQLTVAPTYGFYDDPEWGVDLHREDCLFVLSVNSEVGYHSCERSILYDDMTGYVDELQNEEDLPDGKFIVTYFWYDGFDLQQLVDMNITKAEIIQNVKDQKYREGADYFLMEDSE